MPEHTEIVLVQCSVVHALLQHCEDQLYELFTMPSFGSQVESYHHCYSLYYVLAILVHTCTNIPCNISVHTHENPF